MNPDPKEDPQRTTLGFAATQCACAECTKNCRFMPGNLIPEDLPRMHEAIAPELHPLEFAEKYLLASPGAQVGKVNEKTKRLEIFRIPTLVPARKKDGSCVFLADEGKCQIHVVAPFGCRFFDNHMDGKTADTRVMAGLNEILKDNAARGEYKRTWDHLNASGRIAPSPNESRAAMSNSERIPTQTEEPDSMKARLAQAFHPLVRVEMGADGLPPYRPGQHRRHVFDFPDGLRLIVSRDDLDPWQFVKGEVLHVSASFDQHSRLYHQLQTMIRKGTQRLEREKGWHREAALPEAVNRMKDNFCDTVVLRFAELTGYTLARSVTWSDQKGVLHWFESWVEFETATGLKPQE